ncbi:MAG: hypothetical protein GY950_04775 [bacterium]|nr:hypothetical protein [bacterium]
MAKLTTFFLSELKQFLRNWNIIAWIVLFAVTLFLGNMRAREIKAASAKEAAFIQIQNNRFKTTPNYEGYGRDGITSLFMASPMTFLFTNAILPPDLTAKVDSTVCLSISNNIKSKSLSPGNLIYQLDFSGIVLFVLFFMILFSGFDAMQNKKQLKFLSGLFPNKKCFFTLVISRFLVLTSAFLLLLAAQLIPPEIHGLQLSSTDYSGLLDYLAVTLPLMAFFFSCGLILGILKFKGRSAAFLIFAVWFGFIYVIPGAIISSTEEKIPDAIEDYQTELEKFSVMIGFEKEAIEEIGKFDKNNIEAARKVIEKYWNDYYKKVIAPLEEKLRNKFYTAVDRFQKRAVWFPTSFYMATCNELSSRGYENFFTYYDFVRALKAKFVRFWIDRVFYHDPTVMVNFMDSENVIFKAQSRPHPYFKKGVTITLGYIVILLLAAYLLYQRSLSTKTKKPGALDTVTMELYRNMIITVSADSAGFSEPFIDAFFKWAAPTPQNEPPLGSSVPLKQKAYFLGKLLEGINKKWTAPTPFKGKITIDGKELSDEDRKTVLYLPHPSHIGDDMTVGDLLVLLKKMLKLTDKEYGELITKAGADNVKKSFSGLEPGEQANFLLSAAELDRWNIIILDDFSKGLLQKDRLQVSVRVEALKKEGGLLLDVISDGCYWVDAEINIIPMYKDGSFNLRIQDHRNPAEW